MENAYGMAVLNAYLKTTFPSTPHSAHIPGFPPVAQENQYCYMNYIEKVRWDTGEANNK